MTFFSGLYKNKVRYLLGGGHEPDEAKISQI